MIYRALLLVTAVLALSVITDARRDLHTAGPKVLKEYEQCGGAGGDCAKYNGHGRRLLTTDNCNDTPFINFECKRGVEADGKTPNRWYWQCVKKVEEPEEPPKEPEEDKTLSVWEQCGGAGGRCADYGTDNCLDAPFVGYICPAKFECVKGVEADRKTPNKWYWQCVEKKEDTPDDGRDDGGNDGGDDGGDIGGDGEVKTLEEYGQCGGEGGECAKYGADKVNCRDAAFVGYVCPTNFKCQKQGDNKWYWQCVKA